MSKRNKKRRNFGSWNGQRQIAPSEVRAQTLESLDLGFLDAAVVTPHEFRMCQIIVVGCGGIGAYMVQHIGRMMRVLYQSDKGVHLTLVDPDVVEYKNIGRQLFCDAEEGVPKAEALARRYGHAWGLNVSSFVGKFDDSLVLGSDLTVIVGCVDNPAARRVLSETLDRNDQLDEPSVWWLDCGNLQDTGRVLLGTSSEISDLRGAFHDKTKCLRLPSPGIQSPGLLEDGPEDLPESGIGCADLAAANLQSLNINARIAAEASDFLARLLITKDLKRFAWECNLAAGSARSSYVTPEALGHVIHRPAAYLLDHSPQNAEIWTGDRIADAMIDGGAAQDALLQALEAEGLI